ncbi:TPA: error-prone DNA polymerase [Burkholderia vietnamiensis]|uniref:error-prone DNA polymerase n=1 Tax=Burkholderia vietnamiensis TaxID=60552 RepID=UPI00159453D1|nr:error-prone DNA polymerase [Burkholderia vietnamiensis]HDR8918798.1 error-prone DNA polymerase [Burkholderia vietnamiensis]HDR8976989.1 error-prone DNA polymerase [Burkholderia vietnamiensis]HDR9049862.1 error-prone DNA polymerase [Burkholderia vietnamiensis]HDR9191203.1 error-prone DNA polymerase [Burkholderia vietnamiensis]HDR9236141.1 error-prone DNA polymerase [Burkholderia vietnamiensis]
MDAGSFGALPAYAELQVASDFSFLHGASRAEEYVARAAQLGYSAIAITDECSLAGVVRAHVEAKAANMPLIIGSHFRLRAADGTPAIAFTALAMNRDGYGNLCELVSLGRMRGKKGTYRLAPLDLEHPEAPYTHLRGLPDCIAILSPDFPANEQRLDAQVEWIARVFGDRAWVALTLHARAMDDIHRGVVERVATRHGVPVVATSWPLMHVRSRKPLQDVLTGIRVGRPVSECGYELAPNAERHLRSRLRLANLYPTGALEETVRVARRCTFSLDDLKYEYPDEVVPAGYDAATYLREQTYIGARRRFPAGIPVAVQAQIEHELQLIAELKYEAYFLTVYDIVQFAREQGILCQGRGSAANSSVCYCLGVTEVDPSRQSMLFERFISKERNEPPDIDVDFEHQRREEVMQYIYRKYGRDRAALTAAVTTYRPRSALREAGKALGVDPAIVDRVAKQHHWFDSRADLLQRFAEAGLNPDAPLNQQWAAFAAQLLGYPRHLSQHSGGFVISRGKLTRLVPVENAAMEDRSIIQWDKDDIEALGILKIDVLALGMLSMVRRALDMISEKRGETFELQDIPAEDKATYDMLCDGDSMGVFQVESRAQMSMLPRLRPQCFYDLVIEVAIVRPGPVQGGMVHPFLRRRQGLEPVTFPSEGMQKALARTLGVPIFQEQVMQVAMLAAGFSAGEADQLRRAMAAWKRKGGLEPYHDRLVSGMLERGYDREFAESIFAQIKGFGEYGFPESHAASFALLVYASAWLRRHEPAVFLAALLNSQPMGFYTPSQLLQDARRRGVKVLPVDVNVSTWDSAIEGPTTSAPVRLGFSLLRGMREDVAGRIELARAARSFVDVADLARRARLDRHDLQVLARANALRSLAGGNRRAALWLAAAAVPDRDLLRGTERDDAVPALPQASEGAEIVTDYRSMGFTLGRHPLALLRERLALDRLQSAEQLQTLRSGQLARACGLVTVRQRPGTANGVLFMTLEDETGQVNVILWPGLLEKFRKEALGAALLAVYGVWQAEGKVRHLIASKLVDRTELLGALPTTSREFC